MLQSTKKFPVSALIALVFVGVVTCFHIFLASTVQGYGRVQMDCQSLSRSSRLACDTQHQPGKQIRHLHRMAKCAWFPDSGIQVHSKSVSGLEVEKCYISEPTGTWLFVKIGPLISFGGDNGETRHTNQGPYSPARLASRAIQLLPRGSISLSFASHYVTWDGAERHILQRCSTRTV